MLSSFSEISSPEAGSRGSFPPQIRPPDTAKSSPRYTSRAGTAVVTAITNENRHQDAANQSPRFLFLERASGSIFSSKEISVPTSRTGWYRKCGSPIRRSSKKARQNGLIEISLFRHSHLFFFPVPPSVNTGFDKNSAASAGLL